MSKRNIFHKYNKKMKNMNSIEAIKRAIDYEVARHIDALENNTEVLKQETSTEQYIKILMN